MLKTIIKFCLWFLAFVPLIVDQNVFFPYASGKNLLIESCLVLAGLLILTSYFISGSFREEMAGKAVRLIRNPLVLSVSAFVLANIVSAVFAVDKYLAFWGELSRAEGLAGLIFFFAFFAFSLLMFEKKDWLWFFRLSLFTALVLVGKEYMEYFHDGISRPGSLAGNPTFLAGYLLFSIASALIVVSEAGNRFWKYLSVIVAISSVAGIFITQTRGTILGLGLGIIAVLTCCAFKGKNINYKIFNLRKASIIILAVGIIFSGVFVLTRKNEVWQKVPGFSRLALVGSGQGEDVSASVRLYLYQSALESVNPAQNGWKKLLIGWGPENYILADSRYYNPELYKHEIEWHDRSHNKLLDVLVMNGTLGLLAYLVIWLLLFRHIFKRKGFSLSQVGPLFFGLSYLGHLMFVFDEISTYVPFFVVLAFAAFERDGLSADMAGAVLTDQEEREKREILSGSFLAVLVVLLSFIFLRNTLPGYLQMRDYTYIIKTQNPVVITDNIDSALTPLTVAQMDMRRNFMEIADSLYNKKPDDAGLKLIDKSIAIAEDYVKRRPTDFGFMTTLADFYNRKTVFTRDPGALKRGEDLFRLILSYSPNRPDINRGLASNLYKQGNYSESFDLFEKIFTSNPGYFNKDKSTVEAVYIRFIQYFYEREDKADFIRAAQRLKDNNYDQAALLDKILDYLNRTGTWPKVDFK